MLYVCLMMARIVGLFDDGSCQNACELISLRHGMMTLTTAVKGLVPVPWT